MVAIALIVFVLLVGLVIQSLSLIHILKMEEIILKPTDRKGKRWQFLF